MERFELDSLSLAVSAVALAKEHVERPLLHHRIDVLHEVAADHAWLDVEVTEKQLLVDIAHGFDVLVMGADKWLQIQDPIYYGNDHRARDTALLRLPELAIAPRDGIDVPDHLELDVGPGIVGVSSTAAREGTLAHMCDAARRFDRQTGAWTDPDRYEQWISGAGQAGR